VLFSSYPSLRRSFLLCSFPCSNLGIYGGWSITFLALLVLLFNSYNDVTASLTCSTAVVETNFTCWTRTALFHFTPRNAPHYRPLVLPKIQNYPLKTHCFSSSRPILINEHFPHLLHGSSGDKLHMQTRTVLFHFTP